MAELTLDDLQHVPTLDEINEWIKKYEDLLLDKPENVPEDIPKYEAILKTYGPKALSIEKHKSRTTKPLPPPEPPKKIRWRNKKQH